MSTITITVAEFEQLKALVEKLGGNVGKSGAVVAEAPAKAKKEKKEKRAGAPRAWSDYTKLFTEACRAYNEGKPKQEKMLVPAFAAKYRAEHQEEWKAFEAKWKEEHPKTAPSAAASEAGDSASEAGDAASEASEKKERKKRAPLSEAAKAQMKAKRTATLAAKKAAAEKKEEEAKEEAAPAPAGGAAAPAAEAVAEEDEEEVECELLPFKLAGEKYFRYGVLVNGKPQWRDGFLWENEKGVKGDFAGLLSADGKEIDTSVEEPEEE